MFTSFLRTTFAHFHWIGCTYRSLLTYSFLAPQKASSHSLSRCKLLQSNNLGEIDGFALRTQKVHGLDSSVTFSP